MEFYKDNMYLFEQDDRTYVVKPMNCPGHILMYKRKTRGWRSLPVRYAELGTVYRAELKGTLHGLMRVRGFTQDDAHIFCTPEQLENEVSDCIRAGQGHPRHLRLQGVQGRALGARPAEQGQVRRHRRGVGGGRSAPWSMPSRSTGCPTARVEGEAVFYGPKIDVKLVDAIGRTWQTSTIQFDFNLPRRFEVHYTDQHGQEKYVYMVHRAIMGSLERFIGVLTEHCAGDFPLWLAPEQVRVLSVSRDQHDYAEQVAARLRAKGLRAEADSRDEKIGFKIREAEVMRVPWMLVVGGREAEQDEVAVRVRHGGDRGSVAVEALAQELLDAVAAKS